MSIAEPVIRQSRLILDSHLRATGEALLPASGSDAKDADALYAAPFVIASTNADPDPILTYGNAAALRLWNMPWETFTRTPGRMTAEAPERSERERFLNEVRQKGFIRNYSGVRVTADGRRFRISEALVWNLTDAAGNYLGQAVRFDRWEWL